MLQWKAPPPTDRGVYERQPGPDSRTEVQPPQQGQLRVRTIPDARVLLDGSRALRLPHPPHPQCILLERTWGAVATTSPGAVLMPPRVPGQRMLEEIREQPGVLERVCRFEGPTAAALARRLRVRRPQMVVLAARGTSDNAAIYGRYLIETHLGIPVSLAAPSVVTLYGARLRLRGPW